MRKFFVRAAALLVAWMPLRAQTIVDQPHVTLSIYLGAAQTSRRDRADSPIAYAGFGQNAQIVFDSYRSARHVFVSASAANTILAPQGNLEFGDPSPEVLFGSYALESGIDWRLHGGSAQRGWLAIGVALDANATVARHRYSDEVAPQQNFDIAAVTLAPTARWSRLLGDGQIDASIAVPLFALLDRPYADARFVSEFSTVRFAPISSYREVRAALSYSFMQHHPVGLTVAYRVDAINIRDIDPLRRLSQSLSIGVVRTFGGRP